MYTERTEQRRYRRYRRSAGVARRDALRLADAWKVLDRADDLELLVSELVTNAVIHGDATSGTPVQVAYHLNDERLRVEVRDHASGMPQPVALAVSAAAESEHGRGLLTVDAIADAWGIDQRVLGKAVWFELWLSEASDTCGHRSTRL
jgi:anti-sigma regulatory factor (Ser/Thr protein kinase)